ncbi:monooxygenase family protein [Listeria seeligeri FSL N1-067]|uniref:Monooxygenase family protein n=1 Tax=Listeria seeligeri FSL N1-067 TaxID=702453 RepID=E3ZTN9_LISSE|nr:putative quinol monooxygenase [Listeria seeligeri]EFR99010.1 monooxygenase family protein [Listeria seeligeri FSL N1-067]
MLYIEAKVQVNPTLVEEFLAEVKLVIADSLQEEGNYGYQLVRSVDEINTFYILEKWADDTAIKLHNSTAHYKKFKQNIPTFLTRPIEVALLSPVEK